MKMFAGSPKIPTLSLIEALYRKGILGEDEALNLEQIIDLCAEEIANTDDETSVFDNLDPDEPRPVGKTWEYEDWTVEWEGKATFQNYREDDVNYSESTMTSCTIERAEAYRGDEIENAQDVKEQLQVAVNKYIGNPRH